MKKFEPRISIITIVYNGVDLLEGTIKSVLEQEYSNIEYLIIDGGSTDGTLALIEKYDAKISKWISEPDDGLYDAMNKGLEMATGDFLWYMNAGDHIAEPSTLAKAIAKCDETTDIIFGAVMMVDEDRQPLGTRSEITTQKLPDQLNWKSLRRGMVVSHQAFLPRKKIVEPYLPNNLSADIDWVIKSLKRSKKNTATKMILANYLIGGVSKKRHRESLWDRYEVLKKHYGFFPNLWNHFWIVVRAIFKKNSY